MVTGGWGLRTDVNKDFCVRIPQDKRIVSDEQAVSVNLAYATSYLGLIELARLKKNEKVLIH